MTSQLLDGDLSESVCDLYENKLQSFLDDSSPSIKYLPYFLYSLNKAILKKRPSKLIESMISSVEQSAFYGEVEGLLKKFDVADFSDLDWSSMGLVSSLD